MNENNGWAGKPGVPLDTVDGHKLKADAGLSHLPTQLTYDCRLAISGQGPLAYTWEDKPHRLIYDLCREIERIAGSVAPNEATALQKRVVELEGAVIQCRSLTKFLKPQADRIAELEGALITAQNMLSEMGISSAEKCQMAYDYLREANAALGGKDEPSRN